MSTDFSKQINSLNSIITTLYDGENGFKEAAKEIENTALATRFQNLAEQRYNFGHEVKPLIKELGGTVDKGGSTLASIHRAWIDLKSVIASNDEAAILNECVRGEEKAQAVYQDVIDNGALSPEAVGVLRRQQDYITASLNEMRRLSEAYATA